MKLGIIGTKKGMTQIYKDGVKIPVTVIQVEPNFVIQVKKKEKEGYQSVQLGSLKNKWYRGTKPVLVHVMKAFGMSNEEIEKEIEKRNSDKIFTFRVLKEFLFDDTSAFKPGDELDITKFGAGDKVTISGTSKGRGFQGVMKRWGAHGGPAAHGTHFLRRPGSIGASTPSRVAKGRHMPGHMGVDKVTLRNIPVVDVLTDKNIILVKGGVPGPVNGIVYLEK